MINSRSLNCTENVCKNFIGFFIAADKRSEEVCAECLCYIVEKEEENVCLISCKVVFAVPLSTLHKTNLVDVGKIKIYTEFFEYEVKKIVDVSDVYTEKSFHCSCTGNISDTKLFAEEFECKQAAEKTCESIECTVVRTDNLKAY